MNSRICIVTFELQDIAPTGGIGTANQYLAKSLSRAGHDVHLLYTHAAHACHKGADYWRQHYQEQYGLPLTILAMGTVTGKKRSFAEMFAYLVFKHFDSSPPYDLILFHDMTAAGFFCLKNKKNCLALQNTCMGVVTHSPCYWVYERNAMPVPTIDARFMADMERACVEMADFVVSPSQYLVDYMQEHQWKLPVETYVIPNPLFESGQISGDSVPKSEIFTSTIDEIVFFGRLDVRKGIYEFLDALCLVPEQLLAGKTITLLGEIGQLDQKIFNEKLSSLKRRIDSVQHIAGKDAQGARDYLKSRQCLAVFPSQGDNSPSVIYECLIDGVPFLSSNLGGQAELIEPDFHDACLFAPRAPVLAEKLRQFFAKPKFYMPRASKAALTAETDWNQLVAREVERARIQSPATASEFSDCPPVSIVIAYQHGEQAPQALASALGQDYPEAEVIVVAARPLPQSWQGMIENHPKARVMLARAYTVAAQYNAVLDQIKNEFVVFMDDNTLLQPDYLKICSSHAVRGRSDAVVTAIYNRKSQDLHLSLGGGQPGSFYAFSAVHNTLGGGAIFVKRSVALEVKFTEAYKARHEDWGFLLDLQLQGKTIVALPYALQECEVCPPAFSSLLRPQDFKSRGRVLDKHGKHMERELSELSLFSASEIIQPISTPASASTAASASTPASASTVDAAEFSAGRFYPYVPEDARLRWLSKMAPALFERLYTQWMAYKLRKAEAFDDAWYYEAYPDVKDAGQDALKHYLRSGWKEGRNPTPNFKTMVYLNRNRDVQLSGINPYAHYVLYGKAEGRGGQK